MFKSILSIAAAVSVLLNGGYNPSMTEINHLPQYISSLRAYEAGQADTNDIVSVREYGHDEIYTNNCEGYEITVPYGMTADTSLSDIRLRISSGSLTIDIFKESFSQKSDCYTYISYSNRFSADTENHHIELDTDTVINGREAHIIKWTRNQLAMGDKNHYVNVDIVDGNDVYTIMIKSSAEIEYYMSIVESFTLVEPTVERSAMSGFSSDNSAVTEKNAETAEFFNRTFVEDNPLTWGLFVPKQPVQGMTQYEDLEKSIGISTDICCFYGFVLEQYDKTLVGDALTNAWESGKVCELSLQLSPSSPSNMIYDIICGKYDSFFTDFAQDIKNFGHPVLIRLFNEMNGEWCNYSGYHTSRDPEVYISLYKYVFGKFKEAGADNIIWVWNPNEKSFPNFKWNSEELYYPGSAYVDVVGLTGYNTGTYYAGEKWRSFDRIYKNIYQCADLMYKKPMMITEFSCSTTGGDKEAWVRDMFKSLPDYPKIKAAVWWSSCDYDANGNISRSYFIDDTPGVMAIFKENVKNE